jgi:anti-sigma factor RsiW
MNCYGCERNLTAYIDDELTSDTRLEMEGHLEACERCRRDYETHLAAWEAATLLRAEPPPAGLYDAIESGFRPHRPSVTVEELSLIVRGLAGEVRELSQAVQALRQSLALPAPAPETRRPSRTRDRLHELRILSEERLSGNQ